MAFYDGMLASTQSAWQRSLPYQKLHAFLLARTPRADKVSLGLSNVYVFFSRQGLLFGLLLIITFVMGVNYANNLVLGLFFYLFGIWLVGVFYTFVQVSGVQIRLVETSLAKAESLAWITLEISTKSGKPSRQLVMGFESSSDHLTAQDKQTFDTHRHTTITSLDKPTLVRLPVCADKRGRMSLPRLTIQSVYPLGVLRAWSYVYFDSPVFVYPKPVPFDHQHDKKITSDEGEQMSTTSVAGQNDFDRLDDYIKGESLARVSWSHVARGAGMLTKRFADPVGRQWCLDYADMPSINHEQKLSELAFAVLELKNSQLAFCLHLPSGKGELGMGEEFIKQSLLRLAKEP